MKRFVITTEMHETIVISRAGHTADGISDRDLYEAVHSSQTGHPAEQNDVTALERRTSETE